MAHQPDDDMPLSRRRERGFNDLAAVVEAVYGPRCSRNEGGCLVCAAWTIYDALDQLVESSDLDLLDAEVPA